MKLTKCENWPASKMGWNDGMMRYFLCVPNTFTLSHRVSGSPVQQALDMPKLHSAPSSTDYASRSDFSHSHRFPAASFIPSNPINWAYESSVPRPANIVCSISDDRGAEATYAGVPISEVAKDQQLGPGTWLSRIDWMRKVRIQWYDRLVVFTLIWENDPNFD